MSSFNENLKHSHKYFWCKHKWSTFHIFREPFISTMMTLTFMMTISLQKYMYDTNFLSFIPRIRYSHSNRAFSRDVMLSSNMAASMVMEIDINLCIFLHYCTKQFLHELLHSWFKHMIIVYAHAHGVRDCPGYPSQSAQSDAMLENSMPSVKTLCIIQNNVHITIYNNML